MMKFFEGARSVPPPPPTDEARSGIRRLEQPKVEETTKVFDMAQVQALDRKLNEAHTMDTKVFSLDGLAQQRKDFYASKDGQKAVADIYEEGRALEKLDPIPEPGARIRVTHVNIDADSRAEWRAFSDALYQTRRLEESRYKPGPMHDVTTPEERATGTQIFARSEALPVPSGSVATERYRDIATHEEAKQGMTMYARAPEGVPEAIEDLTEFAELDEEADEIQHRQILANIMKKTDEIQQNRFGSSSQLAA